MTESRLNLHPQSRVDTLLRNGQWTPETIDAMFRATAARRGDALALVDPANRAALAGGAARRLTWREIDSEVTALAARLAEAGVRRGDTIGIQLANGAELTEALIAAWTLGATVSPLAMQYRDHEATTMGNAAAFDWVIAARAFHDRHPADDFARLRDQIPSVREVFSYGLADDALCENSAGVTHLFPSLATAADEAAVAAYREAAPNDPNDCVTICWTSGTEGVPKGVMRAHYDWLVFSMVCQDASNTTTDDVILNAFPMINMAGICAMLLPWVRTGCVLVQHHPFDAPTFFGQIARERVTYTLAPPALLSMLLHNEDLLSKIDLSSLTRIGSGSAPLNPAMVRGWQERFNLPIINFFGSNEGVGLLSSNVDIPNPDDRAKFFPRYGVEGVKWSIGLSEWANVKLFDLETGEEITEPGRPGELHIAGPQLFARYLNAETLNNPFDDEGYLKTGDIFEIAGEQGQFLRYIDRAKDIIIRGGMNIAPVELETLILRHPSVADVAVVGHPDETLGEKVAAFVALHPETTLDLAELVEFLREQHIASYKLPEHLRVVDVLPRNPVGKVVKTELRRALAGAAS
ncbi:class I adenylate-forming enzyme family protein [Glaciibacter psychrotolerans]|uniref:Acyl-CoA synthetase (AMP-forming)/AMP-acid ligase II n=1 Tax=Glaciibacter psychrotolerans TaxID=670054 RepID=A0A7Z0J695_9MICO|nr:class I adenylate-forming enzyme family protein [Leifsonia psychrotolerans]NYJ19688.1 acyl-CoA synthetase (AMP-forming)/AMP-acid ligase II [Leifsonia psychrotolerans]